MTGWRMRAHLNCIMKYKKDMLQNQMTPFEQGLHIQRSENLSILNPKCTEREKGHFWSWTL